MSISSLALLTIGQSPRPDLTDPVLRVLPGTVRVQVRGLLDGLSTGEVAARFPVREGEMPLVTLLQDGSSVAISSGSAERALQKLVDALDEQGVDLIVLLCTGTFEHLTSRRAWLVQPDRIVPALVCSLMRGKRAGIVLPDAGQLEFGPAKWPGLDVPPVFAAASPYGDNAAALEHAALGLKEAGAHAIVLDCVAYQPEHGAQVAAVTGLPVLVSNSVLAAALSPLL